MNPTRLVMLVIALVATVTIVSQPGSSQPVVHRQQASDPCPSIGPC
ncbi:hypothetical protein AB0D08_28240 [Kitasatospora sp. NPDC048540]